MRKLLIQTWSIVFILIFSLTAYSAKTDTSTKQISPNIKVSTSVKTKSAKENTSEIKSLSSTSKDTKAKSRNIVDKKSSSKNKSVFSKAVKKLKKLWDSVFGKVPPKEKPEYRIVPFVRVPGIELAIPMRHCLFEIPSLFQIPGSENHEILICSDRNSEVRNCTEDDIQVCYDLNPYTFCRSYLSSGYEYYAPLLSRFVEEQECGSETTNVWAACFENRCHNPYCPGIERLDDAYDVPPEGGEDPPEETEHCIDYHDSENPDEFGYIVVNGTEEFDRCSDDTTRVVPKCEGCETPPCFEELNCVHQLGAGAFCMNGICVPKNELGILCHDTDSANEGMNGLVTYTLPRSGDVIVYRDHCENAMYYDAICCLDSIEAPQGATMQGCEEHSLTGWLVYAELSELSLEECPPENSCDPREELRWCSDDRTQVLIGHCIPEGMCGKDLYIDGREDCPPGTYCERGECTDGTPPLDCFRTDSNGDFFEINFATALDEEIESYVASLGGGVTWDDENEMFEYDKCSYGRLSIIEYYCNEDTDGIYSLRRDCPPDYICDDARCIERVYRACSRMDGNGEHLNYCPDDVSGYNSMQIWQAAMCAERLGGGMTWDDESRRNVNDACSSEDPSKIIESVCNDSGVGISYRTYACPSDYECALSEAYIAECVLSEVVDERSCVRAEVDLNGVYDESNKAETAGGGMILVTNSEGNRYISIDSCWRRKLSQRECNGSSDTLVEVPGLVCNSNPNWSEEELAQLNNLPAEWRALLGDIKPARLESVPSDAYCEHFDINGAELLGGGLVNLRVAGVRLDYQVDECVADNKVSVVSCREPFVADIDRYYERTELPCPEGKHCSLFNNGYVTTAHCRDNSCSRWDDRNGDEPGGGGIILTTDSYNYYYDICEGEQVAEQSCDGNERSITIRPCPENFSCFDSDGPEGNTAARCKRDYSCSRLAIDVNGEEAGGGGVQVVGASDFVGASVLSEIYDICLPGSATKVEEQECDGILAISTTRDCPEYLRCFDPDGPTQDTPALCARNICERYIFDSLNSDYVVDNEDRSTEGGYIVDINANIIHDYCVGNNTMVQIVICGDDGTLATDLPTPISCTDKGEVCVNGKCVAQ